MPIPWAALASGALSAGLGIYSSDKAADAQKDAAKSNAQLQREMLATQLRLQEPNRALGYGALSDLALLYGYALPGYTPLNQLMGSAGGYAGGTGVGGSNRYGNGMIQVRGQQGEGKGWTNPHTYLGGGKKGKFGGWIDPVAGTVSVDNGWDGANELLTNYLRTGEGNFGNNPRLGRIVKQIDALRGSGWAYDPNAAAQAQQQAGFTAGPTASSADPMARFFTSPDYQYRLAEGNKALERSAAARTGGLGGNTVRAGIKYSGDLAAGEYNTYVNRLLEMAGIGTNATANAGNAITNATSGITQSNTQAGDARASGVMGMANSVANGINTGLNLWAFQRQMNQPSGYAPSNYASNYNTSLFSGGNPFAPGSWDYLNAQPNNGGR